MNADPRDHLVVGIDAGQTGTQAVILSANEQVVGRGFAGPADHVDEPLDSRRFAEACEGAVAHALAAAKLAPETPFAAVVVGLSGYDGELHGAAPRFGDAPIRYLHDAPVALAGAIDRRPGVVVIAGTGSVGYGEDAQGRGVRVGGYGYAFGDAGSSFALARDALASAMAAADRGTTTRLGKAALAYFDRPDLRALARAYYTREIRRPDLAGFARVVLDAARLGDPEARELLERAAEALAELAASAVDRLALGTHAIPVAFTGGLAQNLELIGEATERLSVLAPYARVVRPQADPAFGAARLALGRS